MKTKILGLGLALMATAAIACTSGVNEKVPQAVKDSFAKKFPTVKKVDWDKESSTEWEAEFKMDNMEYSANFLADGTWKETEHEIKESEVPQNVMATLKSNFADYKIKESEISETNDGMVYEFEIKNGKDKMEVALDASGNIVKKEMKTGEEDGEEND